MEYELIGGSNTVCTENTDKRLESQLKIIELHRIITKVHKTYVSPTPTFQTLSFFF